MASEPVRTRELLDKIYEQAPKDDPRLQNYLAALERSLAADAKDREESDRLLAEYEEAYNKLTRGVLHLNGAVFGVFASG